MITKEFYFGYPDGNEPKFKIVLRGGEDCFSIPEITLEDIYDYSYVEMLIVDLSKKDTKTTIVKVVCEEHKKKSVFSQWHYCSSNADKKYVANAMSFNQINSILKALDEYGYEQYCGE